MSLRAGILAMVAFASMLFCRAGAADAQSQLTLRGTVTDASGAVIVGADVVLEGPDAAPRIGKTNGRGEFRFATIVPGDYVVTVASSGFAPFSTSIAVKGDREPPRIDVTLQILFVERVEVVNSGIAAPGGGLTTMTLSGDALASLPSDPGRLLKRLREMAGATAVNDVSVSVDGFRPRMRIPPREAIQMIRISLNPYAPEFAQPGKARIEIITKPGSSSVAGEFRTTFNDEVMNARNALAPERADTQSRNYSGYIGGTVIPNRWSITAYGGLWSQRESQTINARTVDDQLIDRVFTANVPAPVTTKNVWTGSDVRLGAQHTLSLSFGETRESARGQGLDSGLDLPERSFTRSESERLLRVAVTSTPSARLLNEVRVEIAGRRNTSAALVTAPAIIVLDAFSAGGNQDALFAERAMLDIHAADHLTTTRGRHTIKVGAELDDSHRRDTDRTNFGGTFLFGADVERDAAGNPISGSGAPIPVSPLENYRRMRAGLAGYGPSQLTIARGTPEASARQWWLGLFAQDDWLLSPRLTLSYGVRHTLQSLRTWGNLGARAGVAWALDANRKNVLRSGVGMFHQRIDPDIELDVIRLDGRHQEELLVLRPAGFPDANAGVRDATTLLPTTYVRSPLEAPRITMYSLGYERQLPRNAFVNASYNAQRGHNLLQTINVNAPDVNGIRPSPDAGPILAYRSGGRLARHEISFGGRWDPTSRFNVFANYAYLRARSNTDGRTTIPADSANPTAEFGLPAGDIPHQATFGATIRTKGGVSVSPFVTLTSGRAFNIRTGYDNNGDGLYTDRPALAAPGQPGAVETPLGWFLPRPQPGDTIVARNFGREDRTMRVDVHIAKGFTLRRDRLTTIISVDAHNVFNQVSFAGYNGVLTSPGFATPHRALEPRRITVSAGVSFQ